MKKKFLFFAFLFSGILFASPFDFSIKNPSVSVRNDFSYSIVNNAKISGFYPSSRISLGFDTLNFNIGYQLVNQNSDFTIQAAYGPNIIDKMKLMLALTYNYSDSLNFSENNFVFGFIFSVEPKEIFKFSMNTSFLLKDSIIDFTIFHVQNFSFEFALYFDWALSKTFETFFHVETASFFNHYLFCSLIFSTGLKYNIIKEFSLGGTISATYIDFFTVSPYHSEVSVNTFLQFNIN